MSAPINPAAYIVHREFDPKAGNPDAIPFELTERERSLAAQWKCQLERNRRELNKRDTAQAMADALAREVQS